jgi:phosphonate transport system permease protein
MSKLNFTTDDIRRAAVAHPQVFARPLRQRATPWIVGLSVIAYVIYAIWFFNLGVLFQGGKWERGASYMADWISYEIRPQLKYNGDKVDVTFGRFDPAGPNPNPDWITGKGTGRVTVEFGSKQKTLTMTPAEYIISVGGTEYRVPRTPQKLADPPGPLPPFVQFTNGSYRALFGFDGYADLYENRAVARRRYLGWANFWFDPDSTFWPMSYRQFLGSLTSNDRIDPQQSNASLALSQFLNNAEWQHGDVYLKLLQTIVMAFVGTLFAFVVGVPLAFFAARNITKSIIVNQLLKRFFDFLRSMDMLIWALFFTRGFGQGPLAGIAAIFFTETGTLGKLATEALENVDNKQREGVRSVGASPLQAQRYGVVPQVLPVIASQALYHWEANTRSATIIGAMGAGGIGLKLLEAMRTNQDWENVAYMVLLILAVVYVFDTVSTALRRRLISGGQPR